MTDDRTEPTARPEDTPRGLRWARQIIWFIALWCLGISILGMFAFFIRTVLLS